MKSIDHVSEKVAYKKVSIKLAYLGLLLLPSLLMNCRQAVYEIVKPATNSEDDRKNPQVFDNPSSGGRTPGPTARVEVISGDKSVTQVKVNTPTIVRPSADTLDPDDLGKTDCPNPGITKAEYQIASEATPVVDRGNLCDALSTPYTFKTEGDYLITLTVTSNDGEKATASMTLKVVGDQKTDFGGFTITANPMVVKVGQGVDFKGFCRTDASQEILWKYGDSAEGTGEETRHTYGASGSYKVDATCRETSGAGRSWQASVTVVAMDEVPIPPPATTPPELPAPPPAPAPAPAPVPAPVPAPPQTGGGILLKKKCWLPFHCKIH